MDISISSQMIRGLSDRPIVAHSVKCPSHTQGTTGSRYFLARPQHKDLLAISSSFSDLLVKDGSVCLHYRNIRQVAIEMYKVKNGLCPEILNGLLN